MNFGPFLPFFFIFRKISFLNSDMWSDFFSAFWLADFIEKFWNIIGHFNNDIILLMTHQIYDMRSSKRNSNSQFIDYLTCMRCIDFRWIDFKTIFSQRGFLVALCLRQKNFFYASKIFSDQNGVVWYPSWPLKFFLKNVRKWPLGSKNFFSEVTMIISIINSTDPVSISP